MPYASHSGRPQLQEREQHQAFESSHKGEVVAVVGASGTGKSLLADAILGILPANAIWDGRLYYKGELLTRNRQKYLRGKEISLIPQTVNALNPLMTIGKQARHFINCDDTKRQQQLFQKFKLPEATIHRYPFELSGGMARRVLTATALIGHPDLIIADEPTPGLDPMALQEVMDYIRNIADEGKGVMLITHDIDAALKIADKFVIMNQGKTIETVHVEQFTGLGETLKEAYTKKLWQALPQNQFITKQSDVPIDNNEQSFSCSNNDRGLQIKNISYQLENGKQLFNEVHINIRPGEIVGLTGESGIGKTTLAKIIAGYLKPNTGTVTIKEGIPQQSWNPIQLVWQHPEQAMNPKWTMQQILNESRMINHDIVNMLGIRKEWLSRWPSELSGGELQRFSIARAFNEKTKYLILDEISTMLDAITQAEIWHVILEIVNKRQIGVLVISHDHQLLKRVCHRILDFKQIQHDPSLVESY